MAKKTEKKTKKKKAVVAMPKPSGIEAVKPAGIKAAEPGLYTMAAPADQATPGDKILPPSEPSDKNTQSSPDDPLDDELRVREDGAVYARVTKLCQNKRIVIVSPFNKDFRSGRMTIPSRGAGNKLGQRGRKLWVKPVGPGAYECAGVAKRYG